MTIKANIQKMVDAYKAHEQACSNLSTYIGTKRTHPKDAVEEYIKGHIKKLVKNANDQAENRSSLSITVADLPEEFSKFRVSGYYGNVDIQEIATEEERLFNEAKLRHSLAKLKQTIEHRGFEEAADNIGIDLDLLTRQRETPFTLKNIKGRIILQVQMYGDLVDKRNSIKSDLPYLTAIDNETGGIGLRAAYETLFEKLDDPDCRELKSGTVTSEGCDTEIKSFKEHINLRMTPEAFEALYGFVKTYHSPTTYISPIL